jgi:hypothetical protein
VTEADRWNHGLGLSLACPGCKVNSLVADACMFSSTHMLLGQLFKKQAI